MENVLFAVMVGLLWVAPAFLAYPAEVEGGPPSRPTVALGTAAAVAYVIALATPWYRSRNDGEPWAAIGPDIGWTVFAALLVALATFSVIVGGLRQRPAPVRGSVLFAAFAVCLAWIGHAVEQESHDTAEVGIGLWAVTASYGLVFAAFVVLGVVRVQDRRRASGSAAAAPVAG